MFRKSKSSDELPTLKKNESESNKDMQIQEIEDKNIQYQESIKELNKTITKLESEKNTLEKTIYQERTQAYQAHYYYDYSSRVQWDHYNRTIHILESQKSELEKKHLDSENHNKKLKNDIRQKEKFSTEQLKKLELENKDLIEKISELKKELSNQENTISTLKKDQKQTENLKEEKNTEEFSLTINSLTKENEELKKMSAELQQGSYTLGLLNDDLKMQVQKYSNEANVANNQKSQLEKKYLELKNGMTFLKKNIEEKEDVLDKKISQFRKDNQLFERKINETVKVLEQKNTHISELSKANHQTKQLLANKTNHVLNLEKQMSELAFKAELLKSMTLKLNCTLLQGLGDTKNFPLYIQDLNTTIHAKLQRNAPDTTNITLSLLIFAYTIGNSPDLNTQDTCINQLPEMLQNIANEHMLKAPSNHNIFDENHISLKTVNVFLDKIVACIGNTELNFDQKQELIYSELSSITDIVSQCQDRLLKVELDYHYFYALKFYCDFLILHKRFDQHLHSHLSLLNTVTERLLKSFQADGDLIYTKGFILRTTVVLLEKHHPNYIDTGLINYAYFQAYALMYGSHFYAKNKLPGFQSLTPSEHGLEFCRALGVEKTVKALTSEDVKSDKSTPKPSQEAVKASGKNGLFGNIGNAKKKKKKPVANTSTTTVDGPRKIFF